MPLLKLQTNVTISAAQKSDLIDKATDFVAERLSKPRAYIQVLIEGDCALAFAGTDDPTALVELRSLGFPEAGTATLSQALCELLKTTMDIPPERVFINFFDLERSMWGWNGRTFG